MRHLETVNIFLEFAGSSDHTTHKCLTQLDFFIITFGANTLSAEAVLENLFTHPVYTQILITSLAVIRSC